MAGKLAKMLISQGAIDIHGGAGEIVPVDPSATFDIPEDKGQSVSQLVEEVSPAYLRACLDMARRAMAGLVNPLKEGDLPHRMALLLAHRMTPNRKWSDKLPDDDPAEVKKASRALRSLIKSLQEDGEIIIDSTRAGMDNADTGAREWARRQARAGDA